MEYFMNYLRYFTKATMMSKFPEDIVRQIFTLNEWWILSITIQLVG